MNRRGFLWHVPFCLGYLHPQLRSKLAADQEAKVLRIYPDQKIASIPKDVMGLSYETTQLGEPQFFSPQNSQLVKLFQKLSANGVLRLGGNTSEFVYFKPTPATQPFAYTPKPTQPASLTPITPEALHNLRGFLNATGWTCIYGINLGLGTPARAAEEAEAASNILGPKLQYLQVGNEANNYIRYKLRPASWSPEAYLEEWIAFTRAILQRVKGAKLGGPDMGAERNWVQAFTARIPAMYRGSLVELTDHFYAEGPPESPASTVKNLLQNQKINGEIAVMQEAQRATGLPLRMTEVNSCYSGGKPEVSDTIVSALWAGDLTLRLVAAGFSGMNFHGGNAEHIKASLGGKLPGDSVAKSNASDSYYTPIAGDTRKGFTTRPIYAGMAFAGQAAGCDLVKVSGGDSGLGAYAVKKPKQLELFLFNLSLNDIFLVVPEMKGYSITSANVLSATDLGSRSVSQYSTPASAGKLRLPLGTAMQIIMQKG